MAKVAFLGLGVTGFPVAGHLAAKGREVTVYNRSKAKTDAWTRSTPEVRDDPAEAAEQGHGDLL